ncbi:protein NATD1-like [Daphnia pulex]|uniref:protein NATD1-like n=1 Tax=Daphnia pulex TaxID=6669 RepID=UPI001EDF4B71|nr:protein NATD1-like [Daphnia pulex]
MLRSIFPRLVASKRVLAMNCSSHREFVMEELEVHHDHENSKFCIKLDDENEAVLVYEKKQGMIDMYHTEVPMGYTGRGIAGLLAKAAFDHAVEKEMKMKLTCTYLHNYLHNSLKDDTKEKYLKFVIQ